MIAVACAVLALLLSPLLLRSSYGRDDASSLKRARELNELLRGKITSIEKALGKTACVDGGVSAPELPPSTVGLKDALFNSVVLVLSLKSDGHGATGSGFFIGDRTIATNYHVVQGFDRIFVINKHLGKLTPVTVRAHTPDTKGRDFAVLQIGADGPSGPPLALTTRAELMQEAIIGGYPGVAQKADEGFKRLMGGDPSAIPEMSASPTFISQLLLGQNPALINVNSQIAHGNSGGALTDTCAHVLGLPSFFVPGEDNDRAGYALASSSLIAFLDSVGVTYKKTDEKCTRGVSPSGGAR